jgi:DNA-binding transcriptional MerR regulator
MEHGTSENLELLPADRPIESAETASRALPPDAPKIPDRMYFRIGDVADLVGVKPYVLRYWETEFPILSPDKGMNGQRVYRRSDVETLLMIKHLLYKERYSIEGARNRIRELRREGELSSFKKETARSGEGGASREKLLEVRKKAQELLELARTPLRDLFKC